MFTGIIRQLGTIQKIEPKGEAITITIETPLASGLNEGDSVAVNGVCLTVLKSNKQTWTAHLMAETLSKTNLGRLKKKDPVNLERPVTGSQTIDGHFVLGHVDGTCTVTDITPSGDDRIFTFQPPQKLLPYLVPKGSVSLDGVSLTIVDITNDNFTVSMMPYTLKHTVFGGVEPGYVANIEVDILGKHVERILNYRNSTQR